MDAEVALFDLMGEKGMRDAFREVMFWGTDGFLAVADITRTDTIRNLPGWIRTVESVAGDIPFCILLNKVDLSEDRALPPEETAWLLSELPGAPFYLTSAKNDTGVKMAFDLVIEAAVGTMLARSKVRRQTRIVGEKILAFAKRRGILGIGKNEILAAFKGVDHNLLMREVEDLRQLGLVMIEPSGPASFRLKITEKGERELANPSAQQ